ncbi:MAG TPA: helix-turn-helix domain-containing protein [Bacteroidales bacterium]|nr:helix-turn-helix domain-containing protein [Bacteroidales bacterium]
MSTQIQIIQNPEELQNAILNGVKELISQLKSEYQPKEPTEYLTRNEVRELLKVDLSTVHNWTKRGKLRAYGLGNRVYYKRSEIEQSLICINQ